MSRLEQSGGVKPDGSGAQQALDGAPGVGPLPDASVGGKVVRGGLLLLSGQFGVRVAGVISLAIMGRLLAPSDYGIFALALVVTGLFDVVTDLQVSAAIVRMKTVTHRDFDTAFFVSFSRGAILAAAVFLSAPLAASWFGDPRLEKVLRWLALSPLISAFWNPRFILYERDINFKAEFYITVVSSLLGTLATIAFGFALRNYWALVYGSICGVALKVALPYFFVRYRPRFSLKGWREFLSFGGWLTLANIVSFLNYRSDVVLIGKFLGDIKLGHYAMGDRISQIATNELVQPFARAFYPGLVAVSGDRERLRAAYYKAQQVILAFVLPVGVATAICAHDIVLLLAGPKWVESAVIVQIVGPFMALNVMSSAVQALVMSTGSTKSLFLRNLFNLVLRLPMIVVGLWLGGLIGILIARAASGMMFTLSTLALARQQTGDPFWQPFVYAWRSIVSAATMGGAILLLGLAFANGDEWHRAALQLTLAAVVGSIVYGITHFAIWQIAGRPDGVEVMFAKHVREVLKPLLPTKFLAGDS